MELGVLVCKRLTRTHSSLCAAANCKNSRVKRPDLSFFKFPNDLDRANIWAINIHRDDLVRQKPEYLNRSRTVCSEHFETIMFLNDLRNRLHSHAIPTIVNVSNPPKTVTVSRLLPCRQQAVVAIECQPTKKQKKILGIKTENYELDEKPVDTSGPIETSLDFTIQHRPGSSTSTSDVAHKLIQTPVVLKTEEGENYELDEKPVDTSGPIETSLDFTIQHRPVSSTSTSDVAHKLIQTPMVLKTEEGENYELDEKPVDTSGPIETLDFTIQHRPGSSTSTADVQHKLIQTPMVLSSGLIATTLDNTIQHRSGSSTSTSHVAYKLIQTPMVLSSGPIATTLDNTSQHRPGSSTSTSHVAYKLIQMPMVLSSGLIATTLDNIIQHRPGSSRSTSDVAHKLTQTPMVLSSKSPRITMLKKKIHSLQVLNSRRKKRLELVKKHLFLLKKQCRSRNIADSVESIVKAASNFLSGDCLSWLEIQLRMGKESPKGRRYSDDAKHFALNLYSHGPEAYRILSNIFTLPSKSTLSSWLQSMEPIP